MSTMQQDQYLCSGYGRLYHMPAVIIGLICRYYLTWRKCINCGEICAIKDIGKCAGVLVLPDIQCKKEVCIKCTCGTTEFYHYDQPDLRDQDDNYEMYHSIECWFKMRIPSLSLP